MDFRSNPKGTGTPVARFGGDALTVEALTTRLAELGPQARARVASPEQKRQLVEGWASSELLAQEAVRRGLANDPEVVAAAKKVLVQKLMKREVESALPEPTEAEMAAYYAEHRADYAAVERLRLAHVFLSAPSEGPAREEKKRQAEAVLARAKKLGRSDAAGFAALVRTHSEEPRTQPFDGDLRFLTLDQLMGQYGEQVAAAGQTLKAPGEVHGSVVETPRGFHILRLQAREKTEAQALEAVRGQIRNALQHAARMKRYDALVASLKKTHGLVIDDAALAKVTAE